MLQLKLGIKKKKQLGIIPRHLTCQDWNLEKIAAYAQIHHN